jgi:hypothetical protein
LREARKRHGATNDLPGSPEVDTVGTESLVRCGGATWRSLVIYDLADVVLIEFVKEDHIGRVVRRRRADTRTATLRERVLAATPAVVDRDAPTVVSIQLPSTSGAIS